jgi:hypothetical protein
MVMERPCHFSRIGRGIEGLDAKGMEYLRNKELELSRNKRKWNHDFYTLRFYNHETKECFREFNDLPIVWKFRSHVAIVPPTGCSRKVLVDPRW